MPINEELLNKLCYEELLNHQKGWGVIIQKDDHDI